MKLSVKWALLIIAAAVPILLLCTAGVVWLWERHALLTWLEIAAVIALAVRLAAGRLTQTSAAPNVWDIRASGNWSSEGKAAWEKVLILAQQTVERDPPIDSGQLWWDMLKDVMQTVAVHFHPEQTDAVWEMKVPDLLKVIERLSTDLGKGFSENVPGSHILTIRDIIYGRRIAKTAQSLYNIYRVLSVGVDPISGVIRELRSAAFENVWKASTREVKHWLLDAYIKKLGYYAIELYSGNLVLDETVFRQHVTSSSQQDLKSVETREETISQEPLRILVVGQVKAGKSSLINALFGETKALTDVIPETQNVQPYLLEQDGMERAIILDTAGYQDSDNPLTPLKQAEKEVIQCDLILMVCSAKSAARNADKQLLQGLRILFHSHTREEPPILVALTHIDHLRPFQEWQPPYNVAEPTRKKELNIRSAMDAVSMDLGIDLSQIVPVNLKAGQEYNIEEGLKPAIIKHFDESRRLKYLRCVKSFKNTGSWQRLWNQSKNAGRFIVKKLSLPIPEDDRPSYL